MNPALWTGIVTALAILALFAVRPLLMRWADRHRARREGRRG